MGIDQFQKWANCCFIEIIDSLGAIRFYFYKTAGQKPAQMVRDKALFIAQFIGNVGCAIGLTQEKVDNIPSRLIAERFEEELMRFI